MLHHFNGVFFPSCFPLFFSSCFSSCFFPFLYLWLAQNTVERSKTVRRWQKLNKDFYNVEEDRYDISKLPDIYDSIVYDLRAPKPDAWLAKYADFYALARAFADVVVPQEYGITADDKHDIARAVCKELSSKILYDLLTGALWAK